MSDAPQVSIIVPVRHAERTIRSTLESLLVQTADFAFEVIVVISEDDPSARALAGFERPNLRVLVAPGRSGVPQLRGLGAAQAQAPFVAIVEDHCLFPAGWLRGLVQAIEQQDAAASGGPVSNGRRSWTGWAQYFTRYSAFMPPVAAGWTHALPGNNACYRREALVAHAGCLTEGFWEAEFNRDLMRAGGRMWMCAELAVVQRQERGMLEFAPLRFRHGRCYGARRVAASPSERGKLLALSPLIPAVLFARALRSVLSKKQYWFRFALAAPLVLVYMLAWSAGEVAGYLFGAANSCGSTD